MVTNEISEKIIGAAIEVHKELGPGLMESVYQKCLTYELRKSGFRVESEVEVPIRYKNTEIESCFRLDLLVEDKVILELKAVDRMLPVYTAQLLSYLKLCDRQLGLLINFNVPVLKQGIKRVVNGL